MIKRSTPSAFAQLPLKRDLSLATNLSVIVALLTTAVSLGSLLFSSMIYPTNELRQSYLANDLVTLLIGLPILLCSLWLMRRGKLVGLLIWPGALLYIFYNYIAYIVGMPFNLITLMYISLVLLSGYVLVEFLRSVDGKAVQSRLAGAVFEKITGGALILFATAFFFLAVNVILRMKENPIEFQMTDLGISIADIILSVLLFLGGVLLLRRNSLGYAGGLGLLFAATALFIGVILIVLLQPLFSSAPFALDDLIVLLIMSLVCFVPTGLFLTGVLSRS